MWITKFYESGLNAISKHTNLNANQSLEILDDMFEDFNSKMNKEVIQAVDRAYEYVTTAFEYTDNKNQFILHFCGYLDLIGDILGDKSPEYKYAYSKYLELI